jgi:hypothetical protein
MKANSLGLKWNGNFNLREPYWVARQVVQDPTNSRLCGRDHIARLYQWIERLQSGAEPITWFQYDGALAGPPYQEHPDSRFQEVKSKHAQVLRRRPKDH